jgi:transposase
MEVVHPSCCGIDVHQAQLTACLRRVTEDGRVTQAVRACATAYPALLAWLDGLSAQGCPVVAMESTGVYWRPVYHVLSGTIEVVVGNAQEMRRRPGRKTDKAAARWIAERLAHGLIRPSFVPPPATQALRDLTRTRVALVQPRSQAKNRVTNVLEDTNITRSSVVADLFGVSGRRLLAAFIAGERDPHLRAALAKGRLRRKPSQLEVARTGPCTPHHARLMQGALELIDLLDRQMADLNQQIGDLVAPLTLQMEQRTSLPGGEATAARVILAEIGTDMSRFGAETRLASWAGMCPGNDERAGKRRPHAQGQSVPETGVSAVRLGCSQNAHLSRADLPTPRSAPRRQESRDGGGTQDLGDRRSSPGRGDLLRRGAIRSPPATTGGTAAEAGGESPRTARLSGDLRARRVGTRRLCCTAI